MTAVESPMAEAGPEAGGDRDPRREGPTFEILAALGFVLALAAVAIAIFSIGLATRAIDEHRATSTAGSSGAAAVTVSLAEFAVTPAPLLVGAGETIIVSNEGSVAHDLAVEGQDQATPELDPGDTAPLDVANLRPGTYTVYCRISGHRAAGMFAQLIVS